VGANKIKLDVTPAATWHLAASDNRSELKFATDILCGLAECAEAPVKRQVVADAVRRRAGTRRHFVVFAGGLGHVSAGAPYRVVVPDERVRVLRLVGRKLMEEGAVVSPDAIPAKGALLNKAVAIAYEHITRLLDCLETRRLIEFLVHLNEELVHRHAQVTTEVGLEALALGGEDVPVRRLHETTDDLAIASMASRFLIEHAVARPPPGSNEISLSTYDELLATAAVIIHIGSLSDMVRWGLGEASVRLGPGLILDVKAESYARSFGTFRRRVSIEGVTESQERLDLAIAAVHRGSPRDGRVDGTSAESADAVDELNAAFRAELGFSLDEQRAGLDALTDLCDAERGVAVVPLKHAAAHLSSAMGWATGQSEKFIHLFSLQERPNFFDPGPPYRPSDVWPWQANRSMSYLRRPLIRTGSSGQQRLVLGHRHVDLAWDYFVGLLEVGRFEASTPLLQRVLTELQHKLSSAHNDLVERLYQEVPGLRVRARVAKTGSTRLRDENGDVGDIDVLVVDETRSLVLCVEAKRLAHSSAPHQVAHEFERMFSRGRKRPSAVERLERRMRVVERDLFPLLRDMGVQEAQRSWRVEGLVVTDVPVLGSHVHCVGMPVRSVRDISQALVLGDLY
jgi:hypothetical protein